MRIRSFAARQSLILAMTFSTKIRTDEKALARGELGSGGEQSIATPYCERPIKLWQSATVVQEREMLNMIVYH